MRFLKRPRLLSAYPRFGPGSYTCGGSCNRKYGTPCTPRAGHDPNIPETPMSLGAILLIVVVLLLLGVIPAWPHSRGWGYGPSGGLGLVLLIVVVLLLMGRL